MGYDPSIHHRRSIRLPTHDYASGGLYFVTICTIGREPLLGTVVDGQMQRNVFGDIAAEAWLLLEERNAWVRLDAWVVMPNHVHGIIGVDGIDGTEHPGRRKPLGRLVGSFKTVSTRTINLMRSSEGDLVWQRNYYEHAIRSDRSLDAIRDYIHANPANWARDPENKLE